MSRIGDLMPRERSVNSTSHSRKADGDSANVSGTPHDTAKHCHDEELGNIGGQLCKNDGHSFKESCSITNSEVLTRVKWSEEEDKVLAQMINKHGLKNWQTVAHAIPGRSAPQCRQRWRYKIDSAINKEAWSEQEELRLIRAHQIYGTKWREMVKHFPGRTNGAIKEYWRGPMKRKLNSYLSSGLLEQFPDILENLSGTQNKSLDILKGTKVSDILNDTEGSSERNEMSSAVPRISISEVGFTEVGENADVLGGESADFMYARVASAKAPENIIARSEQHAKTRRKLDLLSSPVELKSSSYEVNSQRPLQQREQMSPAVGGVSPSNGCHDVLPKILSECAKPVLSPTGSYQPSDVHSAGTSDPCSLELDISDLMEMSYFDNLLIFPPGSPHDGNSI
ncbi:unnamed protein product [Triticum turgidum subsp. durum]|uniref:Uncharacterized protein n=1 Tax=Triticum turgidum subsp. durum TaxID=4567 RepID=A0A9R1AZR4_TRITD|nr:unnamed protein product [Triticum turgidum subsp. durum]